MSEPTYDWDFFIAHASEDSKAAEALYKELQARARVFLDTISLRPGDDWPTELKRAQENARITIVLLSQRTDEAYYQLEEITRAIDLAERPDSDHRVVPLYLGGVDKEGVEAPYGLLNKQGLDASAGWPEAADELLALLDETPRPPRRRKLRRKSTPRPAAYEEFRRSFQPLERVLLLIVLSCGGMIGFVILGDPPIDKQLALMVLGAIMAVAILSWMLVILRSINLYGGMSQQG